MIAKSEIIPAEILAPAPPLNHYHRCAQSAAAQATAYAILCGLELQRIRREISAPGKRNDLRNTGSGGWEKWVEENCEFSERTARKYIAVADGVRGRLAQKKTSAKLAALVDVAPSSLDESQRAALVESVSRVTEGQTISQLYLEFGITKSNPRDNLRAGGATHTRGSSSASRNLPVEDAQALAAHILSSLAKYLAAGNHTHLPKSDLEHLDQQLLAARELIRPFLKA